MSCSASSLPVSFPSLPPFQRKLEAVGYPDVGSYDHSDLRHFRTLVAWLEFTKIRRYPKEERGPLKAIDAVAWPTVFEQYLRALEFPFLSRTKNYENNRSERSIIVDWLLRNAISAEYNEGAPQYNSVDKFQFLSAKTNSKDDVSDSALNTLQITEEMLGSADFLAALKSVAELFHFPDPFSGKALDGLVDVTSVLQAILQRIEEFFPDGVSPLLTNSAALSLSAHLQSIVARHRELLSAVHGLASSPLSYLDSLPAVSNTGHVKIDRAEKALRVLFAGELRALQTTINDILEECQKYTADPKTDSRLGKVGL